MTTPRNEMRALTGTAVLGALVVVFDYSLEFSGLKIPFVWMPVLRFDLTGIPIALSLFLYGLPSAATTSLVASLGILATTQDVIGASMKALAEFTTLLGFALASRFTRLCRVLPCLSGVALRVLAMSLASVAILPVFYSTPFSVAVLLVPAVAAFNVLQGSLSIFGGLIIYRAMKRRIPSLAPTEVPAGFDVRGEIHEIKQSADASLRSASI